MSKASTTRKNIAIATVADLSRIAAEAEPIPLGEELDITAARLGREIVNSSRRVVGLLPAGPSSDALDLAGPLARAMVTVCGTMIVVLDPERRTCPRDSTPPVTDGGGAGTFVATALFRGAVAFSPHRTAVPGAKGAALKTMLEFVAEKPEAWRTALVDLSGCALPGELFDVLELVDGIVIVGRTGRVTAAELKRSSARVPPDLSLGIVLAD